MPATQTRKFGEDTGFNSTATPFPRSYIRLHRSVRVLGLKRKAKNGTRFRIQGDSTAGQGQPKPWMDCEVVRTSKAGVVTARTVPYNSYFDLDTKDTTRWPHAVAQ